MKGNLLGKTVKITYDDSEQDRVAFGKLVDWDDKSGFAFLEDDKLGVIGIPLKSIKRLVSRPERQLDSIPKLDRKPIEKGWKTDKFDEGV